LARGGIALNWWGNVDVFNTAVSLIPRLTDVGFQWYTLTSSGSKRDIWTRNVVKLNELEEMGPKCSRSKRSGTNYNYESIIRKLNELLCLRHLMDRN